ncbi:hypothetical protein C7E23_04220 [Elizabethkingia anophelis]|nr:hypothetical protein C7E23_04220 [Elizabethkingia anophelis]
MRIGSSIKNFLFKKNNRKYFFISKKIFTFAPIKILNCFKADIIHMKFNTNNTNWWWLSKSMSDLGTSSMY